MKISIRLWIATKAIALSTLIGAAVAELYIQVFIVRAFSAGSVALMYSDTGRREMTVTEQLIFAIASIRLPAPYSFACAVVVFAMTVAILSRARVRALPLLYLLVIGAVIGGAVAALLLVAIFGRHTDSTFAVVLGSIASGSFMTTYLRSGVGSS